MKHFRSISLGILGAILFLVPLVFWQGFFFAGTFTKTIIFFIGTELAFLFWILEARIDIKNPIGLAVAASFVMSFLASALGADFYQSVWSNYERMLGLFTLGHVVIFFFMLTDLLSKENERLRLMQILGASAIVVSLIGIFEYLSGPSTLRIESTLKNAAFLASYLVPSFFVALWLFLQSKRITILGVLWGVGSALMLLALLLTGTRGALLAVGISVVFLAVLFLVFGPNDDMVLSLPHRSLKKIVLGLLLVGVLAASILIAFRNSFVTSPYSFVSRLASLSLNDRTVSGRFLSWRVALDGWKERPLLGWGVENFNLMFNAHYDPRLVDQEPWFDRAHNFVLDVGSTTGFVGLLLYLAIFSVAAYTLIRTWQAEKKFFWTFAVSLALLLAFLVQDLFVFDTLTSLLVLFSVLAFIASKNQGSRMSHQALWRLGVGILCVVPLFVFGIWKPALESYYGKRGYDVFADGRDQEAEALVEQALSYNTYGNVDVRRAVAEYVFDFLKRGGKRDPHALKAVIDYAIAKMEENIQEKPKDVKWYMYEGQLYNLRAVMLGANDPDSAKKAEEKFLEAIRLSPGRPQNYLEVAQAREVEGNWMGMWHILDEVLAKAPDHLTIHYNILVHAINVRDRDREARELEYVHLKGLVDYESIRDAYFKNGRYADAAQMQRAHIGEVLKNPDYPKDQFAKLYETLAALYKKAGDISHAREAALKVGELDPSLEAEVQAFLGSL